MSTFQSFVSIPHAAWAAELTDDLPERNELYGWKLGFGSLGASGWILAATIVVGSVWTLAFMRADARASKIKATTADGAVPFMVSLEQAGRNPRFLLLLVA